MHAILDSCVNEDQRDTLFKKASECSLDSMSDEEKIVFCFPT